MSDRLLKAVYAMQACHALAERNRLYKYTALPYWTALLGRIAIWMLSYTWTHMV
jgi:hypothetical protein